MQDAKDEQVSYHWPLAAPRPDHSIFRLPHHDDRLRESSRLESDAHCIVLAHHKLDEEYGGLKSDGELIVASSAAERRGPSRSTMTALPSPSAKLSLLEISEWKAS